MTRGAVVAYLLSAVLIVVGIVMLVDAPAPARRFGWFSYSAIPDGSLPLRGATLISDQTIAGAGLIVLGSLLACTLIGV